MALEVEKGRLRYRSEATGEDACGTGGRKEIMDKVSTDVLIIGSGMAGINAAIEAKKNGVESLLVNKGVLGKDGAATWMAGWGFSTPLVPGDSLEVIVKDVIRCGKFLNNQDNVYAYLKESLRSMDDLSAWGIKYKKKGNTYLEPYHMPGHSFPRHPKLDGFDGRMTGYEYKRVFAHQVRANRVKTVEDVLVTDLLCREGTVVGAFGLDLDRGEPVAFAAKSVIVATGGFMGCYEFTSANPTLTGDGHAAMYRAGVRMVDMEFVQFLPTVAVWPLGLKGVPNYCWDLYINLHGIFYNKKGERFMERYNPGDKDWTTREKLSRAIWREIKEGRGSSHGGCYLTFRHLPRNLVKETLDDLGNMYFKEYLNEAGIDLVYDGWEVAPGAHYVQGGARLDTKCQTSIEGLFAVGEAGSGSKDGADRLAGAALPFCMGQGYIAGREAASRAKKTSLPEIPETKDQAAALLAPLKRARGESAIELKKQIKKVMSNCTMYSRTAAGLDQALQEIRQLRKDVLPRLATKNKSVVQNREWSDALEAANMLDIGEVVAIGAATRKESRGLHERDDFPREDPAWLKRAVITLKNGAPQVEFEEVTFPLLKPSEVASVRS
ncbi:MAG: FAD-binding protein [Chloroflexi bacterium]|nr:FAD-binding protein [Chloroflexota bacterium]